VFLALPIVILSLNQECILCRYMKRVSAHLSNRFTSLVMPVDRLDFCKKSKAIDAA
jgi:hypothetical protein